VTDADPTLPDPRAETGPSRLRLPSRDLFRGRREVVILHAGHEYVLRITKADKLILTK
jgi:hemin uptake protein HemP